MTAKVPKLPPPSISLNAYYKADLDDRRSLADDEEALFRLRQVLKGHSPKLRDWWLGGRSKDEAFLYPAFDDDGVTPALHAVLREIERQDKRVPLGRVIGVWNGLEKEDGASLSSMYFEDPASNSFGNFDTRIPEVLTHDVMLAVLQSAIDIWRPRYASLAPVFYQGAFKGRARVGWMLFLRKVLTTRQIPEAHALIPVSAAALAPRNRPTTDSTQAGTIIVSIGPDEGPFYEHNPDHVRRAHAIETRMVDQDLLPYLRDL